MHFLEIILIEIICVSVNYKLFKKKYVSPSFISSVLILVSTLFSIYSRKTWEFSIHWITMVVITVGLICMTIGEYLSHRITFKTKWKSQDYVNETGIADYYVNPKSRIIILLFAMSIVSLPLYFLEVIRVGGQLGGNGLNSFAVVKEAYSSNSAYVRMNVIIRQLYKVVISNAYIFSFVFLNNIRIKKGLRGNLYLAIPIICGMIITIVAGSRGDILKIFSACIFDYYFITRSRGNTSKNNKRQFKELIKKATPIIAIILVLIFLSRSIVKMSYVGTSGINKFIDYIAYYFGSSIAVLNLKMLMKYSNGGMLLGNSIELANHVYLGKLNYGGNVGTIFCGPMSAGLLFMMLYIIVIYFLGGKLILINEKHKNNKNIVFSIIVSSYFYNLYVFSFYDNVFKQVPDTTFILTLIILVVLTFAVKKYALQKVYLKERVFL